MVKYDFYWRGFKKTPNSDKSLAGVGILIRGVRLKKSQRVQTSSGGAKMPKILQNLKNPQNFNDFYLFSSFSGGAEGAGGACFYAPASNPISIFTSITFKH